MCNTSVALIEPLSIHLQVNRGMSVGLFQVDNMPALELSSPCCPSPLPSPHLSPSYYHSSIPHLVPYLAAQNDR